MSIEKIYEIYSEYDVISTDSRKVIPDSVFFALKGETFDGNKFVGEVLAKGCAYAVSDDKANEGIHGCIIVDDVLSVLQQLAAHHRLQLNIPILAITGTNGKTTTKELLKAVLLSKYKTVATQGNLNNHIGVPLTLLSVKKTDEFAIIEMGANHIGEISDLCKIANPQYGLITNIGKAHLEGFGSVGGVKKAKGELYEHLASVGGTVFYNSSDSVLCEMINEYGLLNKCAYGSDVYGAKINNSKFISISTSTPEVVINSQLIGAYNADNIMAAVSVGLHFDINIADIAKAIECYTPSNNRSQLLETSFNNVIVDAYNANPSSMFAAISNFVEMRCDNKYLILGDMLELGAESDKEHKDIVSLLEDNEFKNVILIGENFIKAASASKFTAFTSLNDAAKYLKENKPKGFTILLKGSRGIGAENLLALL